MVTVDIDSDFSAMLGRFFVRGACMIGLCEVFRSTILHSS